MAQPRSLSNHDLEHLRDELAAGRPPTVWFTPTAVGVEAGRSAKVIAFTEPAEGDFIQVRPTGSKDELSFSPGEMTLTKPERRRLPSVPASTAPVAAPAVPELVWTPAPHPASTPRNSVEKPTMTEPTAAQNNAAQNDAAQNNDKKPAARPQSSARKTRTVDVVVTLTSSEGEWSVDVVTGKKRAVRAMPVAVSAVAQAAKVLHPEVAEAIEAVLDAAREQHRSRVEQLRAELEEAQRALAELTE